MAGAGAERQPRPIALLRGIDRVRDILLENTERFAAGLPANNVLLWGARGTGKSALVKAAHAAINEARPGALGADRNPSRGHPEPAAAVAAAARQRAPLPACSATTCRSTRTTPATNR